MKEPGGQWLSGSVEGSMSPLKTKTVATHTGTMETPESAKEIAERGISNIEKHPENSRDTRMMQLNDTLNTANRAKSVNDFVGKQLTRYVKNDMGTEGDPIRALAERGILHYVPHQNGNERQTQDIEHDADLHRRGRGRASNSLAKQWENNSDLAIDQFEKSKVDKDTINENPWLDKLEPHDVVNGLFGHGVHRYLGFDHLIDELHNSVNPESGLPDRLQLRPESLARMSVPQAVQHVHNINEWRENNKAEADAKLAFNPATYLHKDYPGKDYAWYELKPSPNAKPPVPAVYGPGKHAVHGAFPRKFETEEEAHKYIKEFPENIRNANDHGQFDPILKNLHDLPLHYAGQNDEELEPFKPGEDKHLEDALKYEGNCMGHCVGGYHEDVAEGNSRIFSLRHKKTGAPHVTIETSPRALVRSDLVNHLGGNEKLADDYLEKGFKLREDAWTSGDKHGLTPLGHALRLAGVPKVDDISQIKGKGNAKPTDRYLPYVQDFIQSGNWGRIGDLHNTGLRRMDELYSGLTDRMKEAGEHIPKYMTEEEFHAAQKRHFPHAATGGAIIAKASGGVVDPQKAIRRALMIARKSRSFGGANDKDTEISQRLITSKKASLAEREGHYPVDITALKGSEGLYDKIVSIVRRYPNVEAKAAKNKGNDSLIDHFVNHMVQNLLWLHDKVPEKTRARSKLWYDGARKITDDWSNHYSLPDHSIAGALAALSPQKDWYQNVSAAKRVLNIHRGYGHDFYEHHPFDDKMKEAFSRRENLQKYQGIIDMLHGKSLGEIRRMGLDPDEEGIAKAIWTRMYDEAYHSPSYNIVTPEGGFGDTVKSDTGEDAKHAWGSLPSIAKAISSIEMERNPKMLSVLMGKNHKVRNFFNNILSPNSSRGHVTIDTHAVAAALMRPLSGDSKEVDENFGGAGGSDITGVRGTYPIYAEAYRRAAKQRNILPREMQSITWEAIRGLFPDTFKSKQKNVDHIDNIWNEFRQGRIDQETARRMVHDYAGGIRPPTWSGERPFEVVAPNRVAGNEGESSQPKLLGQSAQSVDGGAGTGTSASSAEETPQLRSTGGFNKGSGNATNKPSTASSRSREQELADAVNAARAATGSANGLPRTYRRISGVHGSRSINLNPAFHGLVSAIHEPDPKAAEIWGGARMSSPHMVELQPSEASGNLFHGAIATAKAAHPHGAAVTLYTPEEYAKMRTFLASDMGAGFALNGNDIVSVFNHAHSPHRNVANPMLDLALQQGGRKLDAFDTVLPHVYSRSGFKVTSRVPFNDEFAPQNWSHQTFSDYNGGRPDVVFMAHDPRSKSLYHEQEKPPHSSDYDAAVSEQDKVVNKYYPPKKPIPELAYGGIVDHALQMVAHLTKQR